ncbi:MAG: zinc ribbon domain-containing protein [Oscillospiraceae bacterium]|nr:zinc ribbon domain-containing protein [Oscillospiraceae bacterium]MBQ4545243.1 zinc ribbon domain-containing protein [Oscillospiraceae bacterium]
MAYCTKCGTELHVGSHFCHSCGAKVASGGFSGDFSAKVSEFTKTSDTTCDYDPVDIAQNKSVSVIAYISWLVLIPLFTAKKSPFARFHTNQGLILWLLSIAWTIVHAVLSFVLLMISVYLEPIASLLGLFDLVIVAFIIIGIINAAKGKAKELPIIGKIRIIK